MPPTLRELSTGPDSGMLGYQLLFGSGGPHVLQYWSSVNKLYAYASSPRKEHRPAWTHFNKTARKAPGAVGIWDDTFLVDRAESVLCVEEADGVAEGDGDG
ncbi:monooxygenase family protein [Microbacterium sp. LBN7]|uniref:monooxygenase family protein n=1 Tax=Microbacterium sp. LBN7 TaxID=3129773 RepID=UPI00324565DC